LETAVWCAGARLQALAHVHVAVADVDVDEHVRIRIVAAAVAVVGDAWERASGLARGDATV
jgi:hypothetical protein